MNHSYPFDQYVPDENSNKPGFWKRLLIVVISFVVIIILALLMFGCSKFTPQVTQTATLVSYKGYRGNYKIRLLNSCGDTINENYRYGGPLKAGDQFYLYFDTVTKVMKFKKAK